MRRKDPSEKHRVLSTSVLPAVDEQVRALAAERHVVPAAILREALESYLEANPVGGKSSGRRGAKRALRSVESPISSDALAKAIADAPDQVITTLLRRLQKKRTESGGRLQSRLMAVNG